MASWLSRDRFHSIASASSLPAILVLFGFFFLVGLGAATEECAGPVLDFTAPRLFPLDGAATAVVAADLDGDGHTDVAVANNFGHAVQVFLGNGKGALSAAETYLLFDDPPSFEDGPRSIAAANLDGDGRIDLVTVGNLLGGGVQVLMGTGDGKFALASPVECNPNACDVVAADFDSDGLTDLATVNGFSNTSSIMLGEGDGSFKSENVYPSSAWTTALIASDLDGDGDLDIATAGRGLNVVLVLRGRGDGSFDPTEPFDCQHSPVGIAAADLDGDGLNDVVTVGADGSFSIFPATGAGSFGEAQVHPTGLSFGYGVTVSDLDRDGIADLAFSGVGWISIFRGIGSGGFGASRILWTNGNSRPVPVDLDEEGRPDIVLGEVNYPGAISVILNRSELRPLADCDANGVPDVCDISNDPKKDTDGDEVLDSCEAIRPVWLDCNGNGCNDAEDIQSGSGLDCDRNGILDECEFRADRLDLGEVRTFPTGRGPYDVDVADLDGDGRIDVVTADLAGTLSVLLGKGDGTLAALRSIGAGEETQAVATADLDLDGKLDLVAANSKPKDLAVFLGNGDGTFRDPSRITLAGMPGDVSAVDIDGDGVLDLAISNVGDTSVAGARVFLGSGDGTYRLAWTGSTDAYRDLAPADFDGDGNIDLAVHGFGGVNLFIGRGDGTFAEAAMIGPPVIGLAAGDVDGDGRADLVANLGWDNLRGILILQGRTDGSFFQAQIALAGYLRGTPILADLDGNGTMDIATSGSEINTVAVFRQLAPCLFASPILTATGASPFALEAADMDADGAMDLVVTEIPEGKGFVSVLRGSGNGTFRWASILKSGKNDISGRDFFLADLDGDEILDLVGSDSNGQQTVAHLGNGDGTYRPSSAMPRSLGTLVGAVGDLDGDGKTDLLLSDLGVLLGQGNGTFLQGPKVSGDLQEWNYPSPEWVSADLDGDGRIDLVCIQKEKLEVFLNRIGLIFEASAAPFAVPDVVKWGTEDALVADLDGDGILDIAMTENDSDEVWIILGRGKGDFHRQIRRFPLQAGGEPRLGPDDIAAADLDVDGFLEIITANREGADVSMLPGTGGGSFGPSRRYPVGVPARCIAAGDLDADGIPDIAAGCEAKMGLAILPAKGDGTLAVARMLDAGPYRMAIADADGNGRNDLFMASRASWQDPTDFLLFRNLSLPIAPDCNGNSIPDSCDLDSGMSLDVDGNRIPDECEVDCNRNGIFDKTDIRIGTSRDCDENGVPDECQIEADIDMDINWNGILDVCEPDCDGSGLPDSLEIQLGIARDCNGNGIPDICDIKTGQAQDCNRNRISDACEIAAGHAADTNGNGIPDSCEGGLQVPGDCNEDGTLNLGDAICVFGMLFLGNPKLLPCGDGGPSSPANLILLDWQRDRKIDVADAIGILTFLFLGGSAHPLAPSGDGGPGCLRIFGCSDNPVCGG